MRTRILSALVVAPICIGLLMWPGVGPGVPNWLFPGWPFALFVLFLSLGAMHEFYVGCRKAGAIPLEALGYGAAVMFFLLATPWIDDRDPRIHQFSVTVIVIVSLIAEATRRRHSPIKNLAPLWLGIFYVGWLFPFAVRLRLSSETARQLGWDLPDGWMQTAGEGAWLVLFTVVVTSFVDIGAYFAGKALGRHKMAPTVSPSKTWEGSVAGFFTAMLIAWLMALWLRLPVPFALVAAALCGVLSQLGDLSKSAVKREIGIKDFGTLIPGHGGILDRFDSHLFSVTVVYWLLLIWTMVAG